MSDQNIDFIVQTLKSQIPPQCNPPRSSLEQMAEILSEQLPQSQQVLKFLKQKDIFDLIDEFLSKGGMLQRTEIWEVCGKILGLVEKKDGFFRSEDSLQKEQFSQQGSTQSGYENPYGGIKKAVNTLIDIDNNQDSRKKKAADKDKKKAAQAYERYIENIKNQKIVIPPGRVKHDKTDTIGKTKDVMIDKLTVIVGGKTLLEDTQLRLAHGRKYGLIGRNGIGKTCLMNSLAKGEFEAVPKHIQVLLVEQEIEGNEKTPLDLVLETDGERTELIEEQERLSNSEDPNAAEKLAEIFTRLVQIDAAGAESRALQILYGLGFTTDLVRRKTKHLPGGWRMRVSLARALFVKPDILLLDEPTNHLDLDAVIWLEDYVINCEHTVIIVSHAREFLNIVCDEMIHFFDLKLTAYKGNYDAFEKSRSEKLVNQKKQFESQQNKKAHIQGFIDKFRANAKRASLVQSRIKTLQKMELIDEVVDDPSCVFIFPEPELLRPPLLQIEEGYFEYQEGHPILQDINLSVEMESRIAIVGANGVGKSTLLNLLLDNLNICEGNYYKNPRLRVSIFTQHHIEQLDMMLSPMEQLMNTFPGSTGETYRSHLSSFGLVGNLQLKPQYLLSGGQKSRVAFAMAVWNHPQILIMDEPTNHLDIDAVNALIVALNNFTGGIIIVSHDQYFVSTVCEEIWYIKDQRLQKFDGNFDEYKNALIDGEL